MELYKASVIAGRMSGDKMYPKVNRYFRGDKEALTITERKEMFKIVFDLNRAYEARIKLDAGIVDKPKTSKRK